MTTTVMKDSAVGDSWIQEMCRLNPVQYVLNDAGQPNGNILLGPVRLVFTDAVLVAKPQMRTDPNSALKHSVGCLFTPFTDTAILMAEYASMAAREFPQNPYNQHTGLWDGLVMPIKPQAEKAAYAGYTPGLWWMNASSQFKPPVVDVRNNPVIDPSKIYPGVWAIVAVNVYASGKGKPKKGPAFGLQTIMLIGDDTPLAGGAPDPRQQFRGVSVKPPTVVPGAAFGQAQLAPPPGGVATFYAPPPAGSPPPPRVPGYIPQAPAGVADDDLSEFV